jgi:hypothetical protein
MPRSKAGKPTTPLKTSLAVHPSIKNKIDEIAAENNMLPAMLMRKLIISGLQHDYGVIIRNHQVINS